MSLPRNQITATTEDFFIPKLIDNVYKSTAVISRLMAPNKKKKVNGGNKIVVPVISSKPGTAASRFFYDLDALPTDRTDDISARFCVAA